jgi:hypothetical protein
MIDSLIANIGQLKHCNSLAHFFLLAANVFTLGSNEHYFRLRNRALPQDPHSLPGSTRDLWTVHVLQHNTVKHIYVLTLCSFLITVSLHYTETWFTCNTDVRASSCGICDGQSGTGAGFSLEFWFFLSVSFCRVSRYSYRLGDEQ